MIGISFYYIRHGQKFFSLERLGPKSWYDRTLTARPSDKFIDSKGAKWDQAVLTAYKPKRAPFLDYSTSLI